MSNIGTDGSDAVVVREAEAERIGGTPQLVRLLVDSSSTQGRLSTQRVTLRDGADGAAPHHHTASSELFFVLGAPLSYSLGIA
jgi:mannose-6-phosphate isomerase-like protein (cupin superfamily)